MSRPLLFVIGLYKRWLSPLLGPRCRFQPSCADYARVAIARFGPARGSVLAAWRLARCQPLARAGADPVPERFSQLWRGTAPETCNCAASAAHCKPASKELPHD